MPKIKTNKSASKRFKKSKTGKIKRHSAYARHLMTSKSPKRKRRLRKATGVSEADAKRIARLLPYS
ncbi:MAG: 50S ribosomal protein L35 [bacterium]|nr:50S ribosomal protein L35 [bacterium]